MKGTADDKSINLLGKMIIFFEESRVETKIDNSVHKQRFINIDSKVYKSKVKLTAYLTHEILKYYGNEITADTNIYKNTITVKNKRENSKGIVTYFYIKGTNTFNSLVENLLLDSYRNPSTKSTEKNDGTIEFIYSKKKGKEPNIPSKIILIKDPYISNPIKTVKYTGNKEGYERELENW